MRTFFRVLLPLLLIGLPAGCAKSDDSPRYGPPVIVGKIADKRVNESSGLAPSRRAHDLLWTHNDSGGEPVLYALDTTGAPRGALRIDGVRNNDWEDLASFELDGVAYLLIADTGDNNDSRKDAALLVVPEPEPSALSPSGELLARVAWRIPVRFPDKPHDCEAVGVAVNEGNVYLVTKTDKPAHLYTLPLRPVAGGVTPAAQRVGELAPVLKSGGQSLLPVPAVIYRTQPTGLSFAADGTRAVVLTYADVCVYTRASGETWAQAFARPPLVLAQHKLGQAEGVALARDNRTIYVTSESRGASLERYSEK